MRTHWQKQPWLVRQAIPAFEGPLSRRELFALAMRDDVESRLVQRQGRGWSLTPGPFTRAMLRGLPERNWSLLVQGVNLHVPAADALLRRFDFVPYARLDDLMVSYAAPGGGVGPHIDAYDVFLLQGFGRRRWQYGLQRDTQCREGLPLRVLRRFTPEHDAVLGPGDMLYLPPEYAHDGVALDACTTYSIGFRAPSTREVVQGFLDYLHDHLAPAGRYRDPELMPTSAPARIAPKMQGQITRMLRELRWNAQDVRRFTGEWLTEPKANVFFDSPSADLTRNGFTRRARREGIHLDPRTQMLYDATSVYINGMTLDASGLGSEVTALADHRRLAADAVACADAISLRHFYDWYVQGYVRLGI